MRMIDALIAAGVDVALYTVEKTKWKQIEASWGQCRRPKELWCLKNEKFTGHPSLQLLLYLLLYIRLLTRSAKKRGSISLNNYGEVLPLFADISYIHSLPLSSTPENPFAIPLWGGVKHLYRAMLNLLSDYFSPLILTNSKYNMRNIAAPEGTQLALLYPPVDHRKLPHHPKTPSIITTSRLSKNKKLDVIPKIAKLVEEPCVFHICLQTVDAELDTPTGPNIKITKNPSARTLDDLRSAAKIYLSTQPTEALGLSILEAMDAGCIPIVPRDGGPWYDILEEKQGVVGFSYETIPEAALLIDSLLRDDSQSKRLSESSCERAATFGCRFEHDLLRIISASHPS